MVTNIKNIILVFFLIASTSIESEAQNLLRNGTLDNQVLGDVMPEEWISCRFDMYRDGDINGEFFWNDPTILNEYNSLESENVKPINGQTLVKLRARGKYYVDHSFYSDGTPKHLTYSREYIAQKLSKPFKKGTAYRFKVFLCASAHEDFDHQDDNMDNVSLPMRLDLICKMDTCSEEENVVVKTDLIDHIDWRQYSYTFIPDEDYKFIKLQLNWDTIFVNIEPYNGMLLLDSVYIEELCSNDTLENDTLYFLGNNKTIIKGPEFENSRYMWSPANNLANPESSNPVITEYAHEFKVEIDRGVGDCKVIQNFKVILNCDSVYPQKLQNISKIYFQKNRDIFLKATIGKSNLWNPAEFLEFKEQNVKLIKYTPYITVDIQDKYRCKFQEAFSVIINCDTLYPERSFVQLDTTIKSDDSFVLRPRYGELKEHWNPSTYLDNPNILNPTATPLGSIEYKARLMDTEFECEHEEIFKIHFKFQIPNVITPNNDGINDCLIIPGLPINSKIHIYHKSGVLVYKSSNYNSSNCWDGTDLKGVDLEPGTYWYYLQQDAEDISEKGFILLVR